MDCSPPGFSVHGILQAGILEWVAIPFSQSSSPRDWTLVFCVALEKAMAPHSSALAWKSPWTEEPGRLQTMGSLRVGHDWETSLSSFTFIIGEGNGNPLQCSCLENPRDGEAWWASIYEVAQSQTRLKRLGSSSSSFSISATREVPIRVKGCFRRPCLSSFLPFSSPPLSSPFSFPSLSQFCLLNISSTNKVIYQISVYCPRFLSVNIFKC